jgi:hypothetical protein
MTPSISIWRRGVAIPPDLPSGKYTIIYRVSKLVAGPAYIAAARMVGKAINVNGKDRAKVTAYRSVNRLLSPNVDFHFDIEVVGIPVLACLIAVAAIAAALAAGAWFTKDTAIEIRKSLDTAGGQILAIGGGLVLAVIAIIGGLAYFGSRRGSGVAV